MSKFLKSLKGVDVKLLEGTFGPSPEYTYHVVFAGMYLNFEGVDNAQNWFAEIQGETFRVASFKTGAERTFFLLTYDIQN